MGEGQLGIRNASPLLIRKYQHAVPQRQWWLAELPRVQAGNRWTPDKTGTVSRTVQRVGCCCCASDSDTDAPCTDGASRAVLPRGIAVHVKG